MNEERPNELRKRLCHTICPDQPCDRTGTIFAVAAHTREVHGWSIEESAAWVSGEFQDAVERKGQQPLFGTNGGEQAEARPYPD